jgi:hypothetical protein
MILCRERLARIQRVLKKNDGKLTVRDFARSFSVWEWEVEQAAALGWIEIETRKPHTGRPSRIAKIVSKPDAAKSRRAAAASMSRLLRHTEVKVARAWFYSKLSNEIPRDELMPDTARAIWQRLRELGSWRAGPRITIVRECP